MDKSGRPRLSGSLCLRGAGGSPIKERGKATFKLTLGPLEVITEAIVADIEDEVLLGYDVLGDKENGPANILLCRNIIKLGGKEIPCLQKRKGQGSRKIVVADDALLPGQAETIISVYVEREEGDDSQSGDFIVEATESFKERYPLQMATTLIDVNRRPTCKVRVLNPFPTKVKLWQDAEIGRAEGIEKIVSVISEAEHLEEKDNLGYARHVQIGEAREVNRSELEMATKGEVPEHLKSLFDRSTGGKTDHEKAVVAGLLKKYKSTFSKSEWDIGLTNLTEHPINTGDAPPIKQRPRRVPMAYAEEENKAIEDLLQKGVIQKSTSPWASPIVLVKKKSGAIRPCIDYRRVNALVKPDGFPLPRIQDCLDAVAGATLFSSFDLTGGYFQIPLKPEDIPKSAFCCKFGHFEITRMPFGLNNAASTFQRTMELVLQGLLWVTCLVNIDDIIVYGSSFEDHIN